MSKLSTLTDDFDDNVLASKWTRAQLGGATALEQNARLELGTSVDAGAAAISSTIPYDALGSSAAVQMPSAGDQALASLQVRFALKQSPTYRVAFTVKGNAIASEVVADGGVTSIASIGYSPAVMRYLRIRESGGTTYFEYSLDGGVYLPHSSTPSPTWMGEVYPELGAATSAPESSASTVLFDNFNN